MYVVAGLVASIVLPQHIPLITVATGAVSAVRAVRRRGRRGPNPVTAASAPASPDDEAASQPEEAVLLEWSDLILTVDTGSRKTGIKTVLDRVSGQARPGRVLGIAGPTGSGKTSLAMALAGRIPRSKGKVALTGFLNVNGRAVADAPELHDNAFIPQTDEFFSMLTVRETLELAAKMRLPPTMPMEEKDAFISHLISSLSLTDCQDTRIGNSKSRGISGGEKKRLSLGCELISSPRLIFADEPTSQLDSFQAHKVLSSLYRLAHEGGHTVILSIHQPSGDLLNMLDDLVLLAQGKVVYSGEREAARKFFKRAGYEVPLFTNPAEFYLNLMSINADSPQTIADSQAVIDHLVASFAAATPPKHLATSSAVCGASDGSSCTELSSFSSAQASRRHPKLGLFRQLRILATRAFRQVTRDKKTNFARFMSSLMSALIFSSIYFRMGLTQASIQDRLGLLQVCCINSAMASLTKATTAFSIEKEIVDRERSSGSYSILPYFSSKICAELPVAALFPLIFSAVVYPMTNLSGGLGRIARFSGIITLEAFTSAAYGMLIGAIAPSPEAAIAIAPSSFVIFIVFGGLYVAESSVPAWLRGLSRISIIKHAFSGLVVNEFKGLQFETKRPWDVKSGEQQLQRLSWGNLPVKEACISQARVLGVIYLLTYAVLQSKAPRYTQVDDSVIIEDITDDEDEEEKKTSAPAAVVDVANSAVEKATGSSATPVSGACAAIPATALALA
jgi:ABC-type multidrug transport system ATPase subunit